MARRLPGDIGSDQARHIVFDGDFGGFWPPTILCEAFDLRGHGTPLECYSGIVTECPKPGCFVIVRRKVPMEYPERGRVLHIWIQSILPKQCLPEFCCPNRVCAKRLLHDSDYSGPVAHGGDHVLADAESRDGVIAPASALVVRAFLRLGDAVENFFQPPVA